MLVRNRQYSKKLLFIPLAIVSLGLALYAWNYAVEAPVNPTADITWAVESVNGPAVTGFQRATEPRPFTFPVDHGAHPEYQTEWWYYTGNLQGADGRQWGYQLTFFRRGINPTPADRASKWATSDVYMAHFALTDVAGKQFFASDRFQRGGALGLAGAMAKPYHVFVQDWSAQGTGNVATLRAATEQYSIDLNLRSLKPAMLQGEQANGLSQKSSEVGNASYYYSLPRMETTGTITLNGQSYAVTGLSWMDHEWGTSALGGQQVGWDWFALQLDDGRDVMWGQLRRADGSLDIAHGAISLPDGTTLPLHRSDVTVTPLETWKSSTTGAVYPTRWQLSIPKANIDVAVVPDIPNQEVVVSTGAYWEGSIAVSGSVRGQGYVELTGYGARLQQQR